MQDRLEKFKKRQSLFQNDLKPIAKMQNLTQNDLDQVTKMQNQYWDELEQIAKMRRIKNYEKISKEELIISLLKSKRSLAELFNNNLDNDRISEIKTILNKWRDYLPKNIERKLKKTLRNRKGKKSFRIEKRRD